MIEVLIHVCSLWIYNNEVQAFTSVERKKYMQCTLKSLEVSKSKKDPSLLAVIQLIAGMDNHNHSRVVEMKVLDELSSPCSMNENILIY